ncbi:aminotransferase class I/II-fold pyridoxal phosphate-dependent enzyme [Priestia megaterium]|uniref:aminotransferase class I/II-fold pyridoxal phosphate-dependent enzyme n=1 Tax=Priestia megaterium TaxID=1404 RepID=UPI00249A1B10|nr:aminotransferase class I/II-fold pyridoxal phosphate-dependent enzyme [Priestia megaterium]MDI3091287.1 aminotransferase class I/II-fold pyridoxal phosphate-dependent enzyme [Priestia megaterium]
MHDIAKNLNNVIKSENPFIYDMLSDLGKNLYNQKGILSQSAEASKRAYRFNATIGIATEEHEPMHFQHIQDHFIGYAPEDIYPYAPPAGKQVLRELWNEKLLLDNPSLHHQNFGLPIVTNALTHGLSIAADLFANPEDSVIVPDKYWGNYQSIFHVRRGAHLLTYKLFNKDRKFNTASFREALFNQKSKGKAIVLLNFPNNPTGYTPGAKEAEEIIAVLNETAEAGISIVAILDDAYFGLFYEDSIKESLFGQLASLHQNILPIKVDGATKENYVWGLRVGFITYASPSSVILDALEQKTVGLIRGTISSSSHLSQTVILQSLQSHEFEKEKQQKFQLMERRAKKVKEVLNQKKYNDYWSYYPFNSGYFMCLQLKNINAETLRMHLLNQYGVGTVAINPTDLRVAFSCVEEQEIEELFNLIYKGAEDLVHSNH